MKSVINPEPGGILLIYSESSSPHVNFVREVTNRSPTLSNEGQGSWDNACDPLAKCLAEFPGTWQRVTGNQLFLCVGACITEVQLPLPRSPVPGALPLPYGRGSQNPLRRASLSDVALPAPARRQTIILPALFVVIRQKLAG